MKSCAHHCARLAYRPCRHHITIRQFHSSYNRADSSSPSSAGNAGAKPVFKKVLKRSELNPALRQQPPAQKQPAPPRSDGSAPKVIFRRESANRPGNQSGGAASDRKGPRQATGQRNTRTVNPGSGQRKPRRRREVQLDDKDGNDRNELSDNQDEFTNHYEYLLDQHGDSFTEIEEITDYAQVLDLLDAEENHQESANKLAEYHHNPNAIGAPKGIELEKMEHSIAEERKYIDSLIAEALDHVLQSEEKFLPRHEPSESVTRPPLGLIGGVPIGPGGLGQLVEDALRHLSKREQHIHVDPKVLAKRLADGEFVKFVDGIEGREVIKLAEDYEWVDGQSVATENVGFEPPDEEAKKALVKTIVQGRYEDPNDEKIQGQTLKRVAQLANGNTYPVAEKEKLLSAIAELLPKERQISADAAPKKG